MNNPILKLKAGPDFLQKANLYRLRLDMKLFDFTKEQVLSCVQLLRDQLLIPISEMCHLFLYGLDGRAIKATELKAKAAEVYETSAAPNGESENGFEFTARIKTEKLRLKRDLYTAIKNACLSADYFAPVECYTLEGKRLTPPRIDYKTAYVAQRNEYLDEMYEYANTDKNYFGINNEWEVTGLFTVAEKMYYRTQNLIKIGDLNLSIAYPCIENNIEEFYEFFKCIALKIHGIIPCSYGSVELGGKSAESFNEVYSIEYSRDRTLGRYEHLLGCFPFLGNFNIITETMAKSIDISTEKIIRCAKLPNAGMIIEAADDNQFTVGALNGVRTLLEPILAKGMSEQIENVITPCILPIPRSNFVEIERFSALEPVITNDH